MPPVGRKSSTACSLASCAPRPPRRTAPGLGLGSGLGLGRASSRYLISISRASISHILVFAASSCRARSRFGSRLESRSRAGSPSAAAGWLG
eukprot:scaffold65150_cov67-Phaeocystis_antarctica.AAC.3